MRSVTAILLLSFIIILPVFSQGEIDEEVRIYSFRNEITYAVHLNSNGFGAGFRYAKRQNASKKSLYETDFNFIKHAKEIKIHIPYVQQNGNGYVYGKLINFGTLHLGIGSQKEIFWKEDKGGISIRYFYSFGPSFGFQKPIYYEVLDQDSGNILRKKFEEHTTFDRKAPFYYGLNEISLVPGIYAKFGFTFEFGKSKNVFNAIETGVLTDAYIKKVNIMANKYNSWIYPAFFISYRFGKIVDAKAKPSKEPDK